MTAIIAIYSSYHMSYTRVYMSIYFIHGLQKSTLYDVRDACEEKDRKEAAGSQEPVERRARGIPHRLRGRRRRRPRRDPLRPSNRPLLGTSRAAFFVLECAFDKD